MAQERNFDTICDSDVTVAAEFLKSGQVVAIPTETVYGLACNAFDEYAVSEVFRLKSRPFFDPLIVHVSQSYNLRGLISEIPPKANLLIEAFWPGPLTVLLPKTNKVPDLVTSGLPHVAVRMPSHPTTQALLSIIDFPLAAPSANPFGYVSPTDASHVIHHFKGRIPFVLDGGPCEVGLESTIVGFDGDSVIIYRLGGLEVESIRKVVGEVTVNAISSSNPSAPGMLKSHYAPRVPLVIGSPGDHIEKLLGKRGAYITAKDTSPVSGFDVIPLSISGDDAEAARNLFRVLRILDDEKYAIIVAEEMPDYGLFRAVNDRLRRAASRD